MAKWRSHGRHSHDHEGFSIAPWKILQDHERRGDGAGDFGFVSPCPNGGTPMIMLTVHCLLTVRCVLCPVWTWGNRKKWGRGLAVGGPGGFGLVAPPPTGRTPVIIGFFPAGGPGPL